MNKFKTIVLLIIFLLIAIIFLFIYRLNNNYKIAISLTFQYKSLKDVNENWAQNFEREFLNISEISEVLTLCYPNKCEIYLKIKPFILNKTKIIDKINLTTYSLINNYNYNNENIELDFDFEYDKKFDYFLVVSFLDNDFEKFFDFEKKYLNLILNSKLIKRMKVFPKTPFADYLYFDYNTLKKFRLDISEIKEIIKNNNINFNLYYLNSPTEIPYQVNLSSDIDNNDDIKNIVIPFVDKSFGIKLSNIADIRYGFFEFNNSKIIHNNQNSIIYAFNKPVFYPDFIYGYILNKKLCAGRFSKINNNFKLNLIKTKSLIKTLPDSFEKKVPDDIYFINIKPPKITSKEDIEEFDRSNVSIMAEKMLNFGKIFNYRTAKRIFILEDNLEKTQKTLDEITQKYSKIDVLLTKKEKMIFKKIDNFSLNDYQISKNELINSLMASGEGLFLDYYQSGFYKIPIILKNKDRNSNPFLYSKDSDILYDTDSFLTTKIINDYSQITRKNGKILTVVKILK